MTTHQPRLPTRHIGRHHAVLRPRPHVGISLAAVAALSMTSVSMAQSAKADTGDDLRAAVAAVHGTACGPLRSNSLIDQAATEINETTGKYVDHVARAVPDTDPLAVLKDLGYGGIKAATLSGASVNGGDAIKALLLQGFAKIPDCSYTDYGVSAIYNSDKDLVLTTVVLAA